MLNGVKITVVDNFQGEENDIILLSLVRSNREAKIGFLKTENRVCVALSRAKKGFYIIGMFVCNVTSQWNIFCNFTLALSAVYMHCQLWLVFILVVPYFCHVWRSECRTNSQCEN